MKIYGPSKEAPCSQARMWPGGGYSVAFPLFLLYSACTPQEYLINTALPWCLYIYFPFRLQASDGQAGPVSPEGRRDTQRGG